MQLKLIGRKVVFLTDKTIGYYKDNLYDTLTCTVDTDNSWNYVLDVVGRIHSGCFERLDNIINLSRNGNEIFVVFTEGMLPEGRVSMQFRGINGEQVYTSEIFDVWVKSCLIPKIGDLIPSEFTQIEKRIQEYNSHPPYPDSTSGHWMIWNVNTHQYEESDVPIGSQLPHISSETSGKFLSNDGTNALWQEIQSDTYVYTQSVATNIWYISHNLNKFPSVTIVDSGNTVVVGEIKYDDINNLTLEFTSAFSGKAFLN